MLYTHKGRKVIPLITNGAIISMNGISNLVWLKKYICIISEK